MLNVDLVPLEHPGVDNLSADITDSGQMFDVMTSYADFDEMEPGTGVPRLDAVVHFAAIPRILIRPDNETFRVNTMGTYNVIEAAVKLGMRQDRGGLVGDDLRGLLLGRVDADRGRCRSRRTTTSIRWTATGCPRC